MTARKNVDPETLPYRLCVGIAVFNDAGKVWAGRRRLRKKDRISGATAKLWQLPQGGIDDGEKPLEAAYRELWEETGIRSVELLGETDGWIDYDLPREFIASAHQGRYRGQRQKWFAMRFTGQPDEITINPPDGHVAEFDDWAWVEFDEISRMVVSFKQAAYEQMVAQFRAIIHV